MSVVTKYGGGGGGGGRKKAGGVVIVKNIIEGMSFLGSQKKLKTAIK